MAKDKAEEKSLMTEKPTKADAVRQVLANNPNAEPQEIVDALLPSGTEEVTEKPKVAKKKSSVGVGGLSDNVTKSPGPNKGNSSEYRLERLATQAPDEYEKVMKKEKTVNAAAAT